MNIPKSPVRFTALLWLSAVQFWVALAVVQAAWQTPYSWKYHYVSDLGNTVCSVYRPGVSPYVCSPWHVAIMVSSIILGVTILAGAWTLRDWVRKSRLWAPGLVLLGLSGVGYIGAGLAPENVHPMLHGLSATIIFLSGGLGMVIAGSALIRIQCPRPGVMSVLAGLVSLLGLYLFITGNYLGIGVGGMERVVIYPLLLWFPSVGLWLLKQRN